MPKLTLELPEETYHRLTTDALRHGRSVEEEACAAVVDRFPGEKRKESREEILERTRIRREAMPEVTASPEEVKEWINFGRP